MVSFHNRFSDEFRRNGTLYLAHTPYPAPVEGQSDQVSGISLETGLLILLGSRVFVRVVVIMYAEPYVNLSGTLQFRNVS